ncbi:unnamed protein product [Leuciscus chuanchicus]
MEEMLEDSNSNVEQQKALMPACHDDSAGIFRASDEDELIIPNLKQSHSTLNLQSSLDQPCWNHTWHEDGEEEDTLFSENVTEAFIRELMKRRTEEDSGEPELQFVPLIHREGEESGSSMSLNSFGKFNELG